MTKIALIDADIFQYEFGSATDNEYKPLAWPLVHSRLQARISGILEATGCKKYKLFLTSNDKSCFRYYIASIRLYKANRASEKPHWYYPIRNFLIDHRGAQEVSGMEADDAISIEQYSSDPESTVICSRDKDLNMVPGWHYSWGAGLQKEKLMWYQDEIGGLKSFYKQLLTGDAVDNIPGLFGVGKSSSLLKKIDQMNSGNEMFTFCYDEYYKRFGYYADKFIEENSRLLWMLRSKDDKGPVYEELKNLRPRDL